ncbi:MAG: peptidylprolyl isomerase [Pseudomonadota bacterium]
MGEVLAAADDTDWRAVEDNNLVVMRIGERDVVIELAPRFAPKHVENIRTLISQSYFDGLAVVRSQDNYVAQWGDPAAGGDEERTLGDASPTLDGEFFQAADGFDVTPLSDKDAYADIVGFVDAFPVGSDGKRIWLAHCYGMVGVGRGNEANSGNGSSLYVVTGHAPRHLDRNVTLVGRVLEGIDALSSLPRGTGPLGFFESEDQAIPIASVRLASELPAAEQPSWQRLRSDTATFAALVESRRTRHEGWFLDKVGRIELCNVPLPARAVPQEEAPARATD